MHHDETASGDRTAVPPWFVALVREHYGPALRYAARLSSNAAEAEDCVQEAFQGRAGSPWWTRTASASNG